jgi:hypothetical protein
MLDTLDPDEKELRENIGTEFRTVLALSSLPKTTTVEAFDFTQLADRRGSRWYTVAVLAQEIESKDVCTAEQARINTVSNKYKSIFDGFQKEGDDIKNSEDAKNLKIDVTWADTEISFSTPSVTVKDQKLTFGVPQVTLLTKDIIFGTPSVRMKAVKTGQYPEYTCHDNWLSLPFGGITKGVPVCTITWHDIITNIPESFIQEQHIKTAIPEFKIADASIVMRVPEFFMQSQHLVVEVPQFKVSSVLLNSKQLTDKVDKLSSDVSNAKSEQTKELGTAIHALYFCHRTNFSNQRAQVETQFTTPLAQMDSIIQTIRSQGADPTKVTGVDGTVKNLVESRNTLALARDSALAKFNAALNALDQSEKEAFSKAQI